METWGEVQFVFEVHQKVLFKHCDPAGIVFYPRYFEIMNDCVEAFFDHIGCAFEDFHQTGAVPTARINAEFLRPSRHGDHLRLCLAIQKLGKTSLHLEIDTYCRDEKRMVFSSTLVNVDTKGRPQPWSHPLRDAFVPHIKLEG